MPVWQALILLALSFYLLARGASWLVDGAVGIAERLRVPKLLIGIVLVGFATSAPEFAVSLLSAIAGKPEMALGNAVGSVIVDDGVALALVGLFAATPVLVSGKVLRSAAVFLILVGVFTEDYEGTHYTVSMGFFMSFLAALFFYSMKFAFSDGFGLGISIFTYVAFATGCLLSALGFDPRTETIAVLLIIAWGLAMDITLFQPGADADTL